MIRTALALGVATIALTAAPAHAAPFTEADTRHAAGIPASVKYVPGSAAQMAPGVRCFTGTATHRVRIGTVTATRGQLVGYCTDGYADLFTRDGRYVAPISPTR